MQMIIDIVIDLLPICFSLGICSCGFWLCGFGLGYKKGWKDKENEDGTT